MKKFNTLFLDFGTKKYKSYDVLPYFRDCWNNPSFAIKDEKDEILKTKSKHLLKKWIIDRSKYEYWGRCQFEFLIASWPFGTRSLHKNLDEFFKNSPDMSDYSILIDLDNIIMKDMYKIDIHQQIMMNIDIITDILYDEFINNGNN